MTPTAIRRVRVRSRGHDGLRARLHADRLLGSVSPEPTGLAPGAILVVRALRDPEPRGCPADLRPATVARWEGALRARLAWALDRAARPAEGPVPADAGAVLFADDAELLACLARDWLAGALAERWWWRALGLDPPRARAVTRAWTERAGAAPAALAALTPEAAAAFATGLAPAEADALTAAIARAHGVAVVPRAGPEGAAPQPRASAVASVLSQAGDARSGSPPSAAPVPARAAWLALVPEVHAALPPAARRLLALALVLRRRPALARSASFARALVELGAAVEPAGSGPDAPPPPPPDAATPIPPRATESPPGVPARRTAEVPAEPSAARAARATPAAPPPAQAAARPDFPRLAEPPPPPAAGPPPAAVTTELGGLLYLVNVGLALGLYGDFTSPRRPGLALDLWDFVALLGRALLGGAAPPDPLWGVLEELAARAPGEPPGHGFRAPRTWRVPPAWLEPFADARPWRWSAAGGRLRAEHPAGFTVRDLPLSTGGRLACGQRFAELPPGRARWLRWLAGYVEARLRLALDASDAPRVLLRARARVALGPTRVDATFALDAHPVAVRLAGLDRTPGWVPAAGRHIAFHYA